ncbi:MAG: hypothetical protein AVDCRST_MAG11-3395, partial [uncultured Gemmatimonadaceae bacterium]
DQADGDRGARPRRGVRRALPDAVQARGVRRAAVRTGLVRDGEHESVGRLPRAAGGGLGARLLRGGAGRRGGGHAGPLRRLDRRLARARGDVGGGGRVLSLAHVPRGVRHPRLLHVVPGLGGDRGGDLRGEPRRLAGAPPGPRARPPRAAVPDQL